MDEQTVIEVRRLAEAACAAAEAPVPSEAEYVRLRSRARGLNEREKWASDEEFDAHFPPATALQAIDELESQYRLSGARHRRRPPHRVLTNSCTACCWSSAGGQLASRLPTRLGSRPRPSSEVRVTARGCGRGSRSASLMTHLLSQVRRQRRDRPSCSRRRPWSRPRCAGCSCRSDARACRGQRSPSGVLKQSQISLLFAAVKRRPHVRARPQPMGSEGTTDRRQWRSGAPCATRAVRRGRAARSGGLEGRRTRASWHRHLRRWRLWIKIRT